MASYVLQKNLECFLYNDYIFYLCIYVIFPHLHSAQQSQNFPVFFRATQTESVFKNRC